MLYRNIPTVAVVFKLALVQLHSKIWSLKIECNHLTASIPKNLQQKNTELNAFVNNEAFIIDI